MPDKIDRPGLFCGTTPLGQVKAYRAAKHRETRDLTRDPHVRLPSACSGHKRVHARLSTRYGGHRFADKNMRQSTTLEHVPIPKERNMLYWTDMPTCKCRAKAGRHIRIARDERIDGDASPGLLADITPQADRPAH